MYPHMNPVAFSIGAIKVHWYGLMYLLGFLCFIVIGRYRISKYPHSVITPKLIDDIMFYSALGVIIGGRIGYCLFYQPAYFLSHPLDIVKTWNGGMSFHGGLIGVLLAILILSRKNHCRFFVLGDFIVLMVPIALFFGRIGNFINGELWGKIVASNIPWAMVFPQSGSMLPRHPSEIYEALGEGILLTLIIWIYARKSRYIGQTSAVFLFGYGVIRFCLEYFREPDSFLLAFAAKTGFSMGQWLCMPMIILGAILYVYSSSRKLTLH